MKMDYRTTSSSLILCRLLKRQLNWLELCTYNWPLDMYMTHMYMTPATPYRI